MSQTASQASSSSQITELPVRSNKSQQASTNTVTAPDGHLVRTRIDPALPVSDVVRQLCLSLQITTPPIMYALRDEQDHLITDDNLRKHIKLRTPFKLVTSPYAEAMDTVTKLASTAKDDYSIRAVMFSLQSSMKEEPFAREFLRRGGFHELVGVVYACHGNTLAYALTTMRKFMDFEYGWAILDTAFILKIGSFLANSTTPINVYRPAASIMRRLIEADPRCAPLLASVPSSSSRVLQPPPGSIWRYGFDLIWHEVRKAGGILEMIVSRLASPESGMAITSLSLLNAFLSFVTTVHTRDLMEEFERLSVRKAVIRLMSSSSIEDMRSPILEFQMNIARFDYLRKVTVVDENEPWVQASLAYIWEASRADEWSAASRPAPGSALPQGDGRWVKLGFESEDLRSEFASVGVLGLDSLHSFVFHDSDYFAKLVLEQLNRQPERRCPIAIASNEIVELLCDHWSLSGLDYAMSKEYQPLFFSFPRVHYLATRFFVRMWSDSSASHEDLPRVASLVRSQWVQAVLQFDNYEVTVLNGTHRIKFVLADGGPKPWHEIESLFMDAHYADVRDRFMLELEMQDEMLSRPSVKYERSLRVKLQQESYEFMRQQRMMCLMQGAWFANGVPVPSSDPSQREPQIKRPVRPWRFYRLDRNTKYLHYVDSTVKIPIRAGYEDLPEQVKISEIVEIRTRTCALPPNIALPEAHTSPYGQAPITSPLSFSIVGSNETFGEHVSENESRFYDWTDGLNMLKGNYVATKQTDAFVEALTDIGLKIKLLDLSGERVDLPISLPAGLPPSNVDFYFAEPISYSS